MGDRTMSTKLKAIGVIAALHLALYWAILGILKASGFQLFSFGSLLGLMPARHNSAVQEALFGVSVWLTYPLGLLPDFAWIPKHWLSVAMAWLLNSVIWGVCLTLLLYAVRKKTWRRAT